MRKSQPCLLLLGMLLLFAGSVLGQAPTGQLEGTVFDESGAVIPGASLVLANKSTGASRTEVSAAQGVYVFPSLIAGQYELRTTAQGFRTLVQAVTIETGAIATLDIHMQVGQSKDVVTVEAGASQLDYDKQSIDGVVTRQQIDSLPLNGRSFLQLAQLEPGVGTSFAGVGQYNRQFDVSILGRGSESVRITMDGATVNDAVTGGTQQNFSQDVVQEFQVSSALFDLSTGITAGGAVNVVTRAGGNDFHGGAYFFYRDHNLGAYPYLQRDPHVTNPYFSRKDPGAYLSGPIIKNKLFTFTSYEYNATKGAYDAYPNDPLFTTFAAYATSPYTSNQFTERLDYRWNDKNTIYLRYSHDGNNTYSPSNAGTQPSNWGVNRNYADSGVLSLITAFSPTKTNEFRFSMTYWDNQKNTPTASVCPAPCFGLGGPQYSIDGIGNLQIGNDATNTPQSRVLRRWIWADNFNWQHGPHSIKFGGEWEYQKGTGTYAYADPGGVVLYSPEEVGQWNGLLGALGLGQYAIKIPSSYTSMADLLQLPVAGFEIGWGDISQPPSYNRGNADHNNRFHFFAQDNWKVTPKLTVIMGLAYSYESDLLNYDLPKPAYLEPILGKNGMGYEGHQPNNWSPALGFAWNVGNDNKTVIRGGAGIYYDTMNVEVRLLERAALGPLGTGRTLLPDSAFFPALNQTFGLSANSPFPLSGLAASCLPSIPGVPAGVPCLTTFTGADFQGVLPSLQAAIGEIWPQTPNNTNLAIRNINLFKTAPGQDIFVNSFRPPFSQQAGIGVQRQLTRTMTVSADFVYRHFLHERIRNTDQNHWLSTINGGTIIPGCTPSQTLDVTAECSTGAIQLDVAGGRSTYKGLLLKVNQQFTRHLQFLASYAYQDLRGFNGDYNDYNWFLSNGPQIGRQSLTFSGTYDLPWGFQTSTILSFASRPPFEPLIPNPSAALGYTGSIPLPGAGFNEFGITKGTQDLLHYVDAFNTQNGTDIVLPANYSFGRNSFSMDFRLTKTFKFLERYQFQLMGECFNIFNYANLGGFNNSLGSSTFGQPTSLPSQVLGSGGPRVFQFGARFQF